MVEEILTGGLHDSSSPYATLFPTENVQGVYPLSTLQQGMLFHRLLNGTRDRYVLSVLFEAGSREQIERVIEALQAVIDRHEILRTAVIWENVPQPVQIVHRQATLPVQTLQLDPGRDPIPQLKELMKPGTQRFQLHRPPLMSVQMAADLRTQRCYALLHVHHVVCDHESMNTILEEVRFILEGRHRDLPPAVAFHNVENQTYLDVPGQQLEDFFRQRLGNVAEPTAPFGLLDEAENIEEGCQMLDAELAARIHSWGRRLGMTPARLFHAAWALVMGHTSGRSDVVFGTVLLANRAMRDRSRHCIGMSVNTLPLRLQLGGTLEQLLNQTQQELSALVQHAHASLADVQRCARESSQAPLFSALLNYRRNPRGQVVDSFNARGVSILARTDAWTNYPITMTIDDLSSGFVLSAYTDARTSPQRFIGYLQQALRSIVDALEQSAQVPALGLDVVPPMEIDQMLRGFNATAAYRPEELIHEIFEAQVARSPTRVAIVHGSRHLTYAELNSRSDLLAEQLRYQGVGPDKLVGIFVERSLDMIVGLLGVLKAGGAYLPLDPNYPLDRVRYMLDSARPVLVLTQQALRTRLPDTSAQIAVLEAKPLQATRGKVPLQAHESPRPPNLLYVIYTSGSTGRPKGTAMPHRSMANLIEWHKRELPLSEGSCVLQFAALSFDVAFQEIFSTICTGGTLVLIDDAVRKEPRSMIELLQAQRIERLFVPPMMLQALADYAMTTGDVPSHLKDVIAAGERLRVSPEIAAFFARLPGCRLHNHYGPTETHVVTSATLSGDSNRWPALPTIGKPIANTQIYILDAHRCPVPCGAVGEVYIGGANLARGYLNAQRLSSERFVPDPFTQEAFGRMYRTGDLGRWQNDGEVEYLGRNDDQVKIRGYRVELQEIEVQLALLGKVKDAVVCVQEDLGGETRLVAYVTPSGREVPTAEEMRTHLESLLPAHMVPCAFVTLERFPVTPSGKLDRRSLPVPEMAMHVQAQYEAPQTWAEQLLAQIWIDLLHVNRVGRDDSFFDLGGHSILAMQAATRIRSHFRVDVPMKLIFECPTLKLLSARLEAMIPEDCHRRLDLDTSDAEQLAKTIASLPESRVAELLRELRREGASW